MRILHLSDLHLTATGVDMDGVDARAALSGLLHDLRHLEDLDLVVVTGDVADDGSEAGVRLAVDLVGAYATEHGAEIVWTTGNHDSRAAFDSVLGPSDGPGRAAAHEVGGLRVVALDSLVEGQVAGAVGEEQRAWLSDVLAEPAPLATVIALHHPPIHPGSVPLLAPVSLRDPELLAEVLVGTDVRAVLCGHFHHLLSGSLAGIPVWVGPGVVTRIDRTAPSHIDRGVLGAGAGVLDLTDGGAPTYLPLQARGGEQEVYTVELG